MLLMILKTALQLPYVVLVIILWCFYFRLCHLAFMKCQLLAEHQTVLLQVIKEKLSYHLYLLGIY